MKVITLGQFERDLDRILDDVTDDREHYCVKTPVINRNITIKTYATGVTK